jgi:hypothetical protein
VVIASFPLDGLRRVVVTCSEARAGLQIHGIALIRGGDLGPKGAAGADCGAVRVTGARSEDMRAIMDKEDGRGGDVGSFGPNVPGDLLVQLLAASAVEKNACTRVRPGSTAR